MYKVLDKVFNYATMHSEAITRYHASGMLLHIHIDSSLLSEQGNKSRAVGYHYLRAQSEEPRKRHCVNT